MCRRIMPMLFLMVFMLLYVGCDGEGDDTDGDQDNDTAGETDLWSDYEYEDNTGRWTVNGDGTVTDTWTGRMWQRGITPNVGGVYKKGEVTGSGVSDNFGVCQNLDLGGYNDWRMPTLNELRSLIAGCPGQEEYGPCVLDSSNPEVNAASDCDACAYQQGPGDDGCYMDPDIWEGNCEDIWTGVNTTCSGTYYGVLAVVFRSGRFFCGADMYAAVKCLRGP